MRTLLLVLAGLALGADCAWPAPPAPCLPESGAAAPAGGARSGPAGAAAAALAATRFVPNRGNWHDEVRYAVIGADGAWLHDDGFTMRLSRRDVGAAARSGRSAVASSSGGVVRFRFAGRATAVQEGQQLEGVFHFLRGRDPDAWCTDVPAFASVDLLRLRPGIDVRFRSPRSGRGLLEYDLLLAPGAELADFTARCEGAESLRLDAQGRLIVRVPTPEGAVELVQDRPIAWQQTPSGRRPVAVAFRIVDDDGFGFAAAELDADWPTVVDPGVAWSTYLGGSASDSVNDLVRVNGAGIWLAGWAGSLDFPTTTGAYRATGERDGFVARLDESGGALHFATYFGGSAGDEVRGVDVGPGLTPTIVGFTGSLDLPVTAQALQPAFGGASPIAPIGDAFVARLSAAGDALLSSTYLGGWLDDVAEKVAVDAQGYAHVVGWTSSINFPTTAGSVQPALGGPMTMQTDGFVARIAPDGRTAAWSTYLGGGLNDKLLDVALDPATGEVVAVGWSTSVGFPVTPLAYRTSNAGSLDMVVSRLSAAGSALVWSTFLGGINEEAANAVALAADGTVWIGGWTDSVNYPVTANAPQLSSTGEEDGAVSRLAADGQSLLFSTLLGGSDADQVRGIAVDGSDVVVVGECGIGFPVTQDALQTTFAGGIVDGFITWLANDGATLAYSTLAGGSGHGDVLASVSLGAGLIVAGGWSFAADFPVTSGALQPQLLGSEDGVVMMIDLLSDLSGGLGVSVPSPAPGSSSPPATYIAAGEHEILTLIAANTAPRELSIDAVRLLVAGAGHTPAEVAWVEVWLDDPAVAGARDLRVGGPVTLGVDDAQVEVPLAGATVAAGAKVTLRVIAELRADASLGTVEVACAVADRSAWTLRAFGAGNGPNVNVVGDGRAVGPVFVAGALPGDADGDGDYTVLDLRRMCRRFGVEDLHVDADGDHVITPADVDLGRAAVLGLPTLVHAPSVLARGEWLTIRGVFPARGAIDAALGGRSLLRGCWTPRELTLFVDGAHSLGNQPLTVYLDGRLLVAQTVLVQ